MATTITLPAQYSSVKKPVVFDIDRLHNSICEVTINGYKKLMPNNTQSVNVANYYKEDFDIYPDLWQEDVFTASYFADIYRLHGVSIEVDGVESDVVQLICADKEPKVNCIMSDLRRRFIDRGEIDEVSVFLDASAILAYGQEQIELEEGMFCVGFRVPQDAPERFQLRLLTIDGKELDRIEYEVEPNYGTRLAWINPYGAIDFWNFQNRRKATTKITKERIYSSGGYLPTSIQAETTHTICSQPLPEQIVDVLANLYTSESVWVIEGNEARRIDITNETATTYDADVLSCIQVDYRNNMHQL